MHFVIAFVLAHAITATIHFLYLHEEGEAGKNVGIKKAGFFFVLLTGLSYWDDSSFKLIKMTELIFLLIITVTDIEKYKIYDLVTIPFAITGLICADIGIAEKLIGGICAGMVFCLLQKLTRNGIGGGDVKLVTALGLWHGYGIFDIVINGSILGGICAAVLLASGKKGRKDYIAYGPYFCIAGALN